MNLTSDVVALVLGHLSNDTIGTLHSLGLIPELNKISSVQGFWKLRVETLVERSLPDNLASDWRSVYQVLKDKPFCFCYSSDNVQVLEVLRYIGLTSTEDDLASAISDNLVNTVKFILLEGSVDPEPIIASLGEVTYLIQAASLGRVEIVSILLSDKRIDPDTLAYDTTALSIACSAGYPDVSILDYERIVDLLLRDGRVIPTPGCFQDAVALRDNPRIVELLLSDGRADPADDSNEAVLFACTMGAVKSLKLLLQDPRVDPSDQDSIILVGACMNRRRTTRIEMLKMLLADGRADPSLYNLFRILISAGLDDPSLIILLLNDGRCDPRQDGNEALLLAIQMGSSETVDLLRE